MKTARRITRNFLSLSASEIISKILQLVIFVYLARIFGPFEFGNFGFALAFSGIVIIIADFGLTTLLVREISRNKDEEKKYFSNALAVKILFSIVTFSATFLYLGFMDYSGTIMAVTYIMVLFMVLQSFTDSFYSVFRAFERMHYDALIKVLRMVILSILIFATAVNNANLIFVTLMFPITEFIVLVISSMLYVRFFGRLTIKFDFGFIRNLIRKSSPFCLSLVFTSLLLYVSNIMLQKMRGSAEVGVYTAAFNILIGITFIPLMYSNAVFPVFSRYFIKDDSLLKFAYKKSFMYMAIFGFPMAVGIYIYAENIISLVYGSGYLGSITALKVLCFFVALRFINIISGTVLSAINRQGSRVASQGLVAVTSIILNLILIPKFGFVGAAFATIISESFFVFLYYYFIKKYKLGFGIFKTSIKPLIASVIMAIIIINIPDLFVGTVVGAVSYFSILLMLRTFKKEDRTLLLRVIKNY